MEMVLKLLQRSKVKEPTQMELALRGLGEVQRELKKIKRERENILSQLNLCADPAAVDSIIYELGAIDARLDYLLKKAKLADKEVRRASLGSETDCGGISDTRAHGAYGGGLSCEGTP